MPTNYKRKPLPKSTSTHPTDAGRQSLYAPLQLLTGGGQQLPSSLQRAEGTVTYTQTTNQPLKRTLNASGNDPQLLAEIFKPTVEAMQALDLLTLVKTETGRLVIILPTNIFNDDLTMKLLAGNK